MQKRCTKCGKTKDINDFNKRAAGHGLQSWCKECTHAKQSLYRQNIRDEKLAIQKEEERKAKMLRRDVLKLPCFIFRNGHTLNIIPDKDLYKVEICGEHEEMALLMPVDRVELLRDWISKELEAKK